MKRKNKLKGIKGEQIFIENDLTWEERKIQERINKWAKEKKSIEEDIKIGIGKVRIKDIWKFWSDIEKEEEQRIGERKDNRDEKEEENERNRNFV